jgi:polyphosphate kinase 2 (PPK2 family)
VNYLKRFKVPPGTQVRLEDVDPAFKDGHETHQDATKEIEHYRKKLRDLQEMLYVEHQRSLLICLQAMDTGGKDGTINRVTGCVRESQDHVPLHSVTVEEPL